MSSRYKYECILLSNVSAFTYETIYRLATGYFLAGEESHVNPAYDALFQQLMDFVDRSLDTPYGIRGFCEFFAGGKPDTIFIA